MTRAKGEKFSKKHGADTRVDPAVQEQIKEKARNGEVACALAFQIADALGVSPADVGKNLDLLELRLNKCQLGLFGYQPAKKAVKSKPAENRQMEKAIKEALVDGKLACRDAWNIAARFKAPKMAVSGACEALGIKIKPCQLGAF